MTYRIDGNKLHGIREAVTDFLFDSVKLSGVRIAELFKSPMGSGRTIEDTNMIMAGEIGYDRRFHVRGIGADIFYDRLSPPTLQDFRHFQEAMEGSWSLVVNGKYYYNGSLKSVTDFDISIKEDGSVSLKQAPAPLRIPDKAFILEEGLCFLAGTIFSAELSWPAPLSPDNPFKLYFYLLGTNERDLC